MKVVLFTVGFLVALTAPALCFESIDSPISPPATIYRVQIGATTNQAEATDLQTKASSQGFSLIHAVSATPYYKGPSRTIG